MAVCDFKFDIGESVTVLSVNVPGRITQRCDRGAGQHDYQTVFWMDGKRQVEWLLEWELSK